MMLLYIYIFYIYIYVSALFWYILKMLYLAVYDPLKARESTLMPRFRLAARQGRSSPRSTTR